MTTLNYKILPTRRKASGKLGIYLAVSHKKQVRYISTEFEIDEEYIMGHCRKRLVDIMELERQGPPLCTLGSGSRSALLYG